MFSEYIYIYNPPVLEHIVAVCRVSSHKTDGKGVITHLRKRGHELADFAEAPVHKTFSAVAETAIVLNGVPSNVDSSEDAWIASELVELRTALQQKPTSTKGYALLGSSTSDGLSTNVSCCVSLTYAEIADSDSCIALRCSSFLWRTSPFSI